MALVLFIFSKKLRKRYFFEDRNLTDKARVFDGPAHIAFEVSSEGEFEQIKPLLNFYLNNNKLVELIYSSDSLEKKITNLTLKHSNLKSLRLPILSYGYFQNQLLGLQNINSWLTAKCFVLCRYDFYPELLLYGLKKDVRFCLVSATFRNKLSSWWNKSLYASFDFILAASEEDKRKLTLLGVDDHKLSSYEFRVPQIMERIESRDLKLNQYETLLELIKTYPKQKRAILGSAWSVEMEIFNDLKLVQKIKEGSLLFVILPHLFNDEIKSKLETIPGLNIHIYKDGEDLDLFITNFKKNPGVLVLEVKGILLELYSYFAHALIGGGHGRSVHSLLEPFLSGCHIYCGPKVHRSTEYDFIKQAAPEDLTLVEDLGEFYKHFKNVEDKDLVQKRLDLGKSFSSVFNSKIELISGGPLND